ncbi:unnamed protein product, partial [marine sediment metagenome]
IAKAKPLGIITETGIQRLMYPVSPGETVYSPDKQILTRFLGLQSTKGLNLGVIGQHELEVRLNLTRFLQKHAAILAISGAGKSYTVSVVIEELLLRTKEEGRVAIVLFDVHGEYKGMADDKSPFASSIEVFPAALIEFATNSLSGRQFAIYQPQMSSVQTRELSKITSKLYKEKTKQGITYTIEDILKELEKDD